MTYFHRVVLLLAEVLRVGSLLLILQLVASLLLGTAGAFEGKPKFGPDAVPISRHENYLRAAPAPDYWKLSPFYVPQQTSSACSVASMAMTLNFIRGLPSLANQRLVTQPGLLKKVGDRKWIKEVAERGSGVTFAEFISMVRESLAAFRLPEYVVEVIRPTNNTAESLAKVQQALATNEATDHDIILAYFNQGVLTGDWDGPHISPIAAYDQEAGQVLIMDVDREWYIPYWTPDTKLLQAMLRPAPAANGRLAGQKGGLVWIKPSQHRNE